MTTSNAIVAFVQQQLLKNNPHATPEAVISVIRLHYPEITEEHVHRAKTFMSGKEVEYIHIRLTTSNGGTDGVILLPPLPGLKSQVISEKKAPQHIQFQLGIWDAKKPERPLGLSLENF